MCVCSSWLVQRVSGHSSDWTIDHWECVCGSVVTVQTGQLTIENVCVFQLTSPEGQWSQFRLDKWPLRMCVCSSWLVQRVSGHSSDWTIDHWECVCVFQLTSPEGLWSQFKLDNWPLRMCVCVLQLTSPEGQWSQFGLDNWPLRMCVCVPVD